MTSITSPKRPAAEAEALPETRRRSRTFQILLDCLLRYLHQTSTGEPPHGVVPSGHVPPAQEAA